MVMFKQQISASWKMENIIKVFLYNYGLKIDKSALLSSSLKPTMVLLSCTQENIQSSGFSVFPPCTGAVCSILPLKLSKIWNYWINKRLCVDPWNEDIPHDAWDPSVGEVSGIFSLLYWHFRLFFAKNWCIFCFSPSKHL